VGPRQKTNEATSGDLRCASGRARRMRTVAILRRQYVNLMMQGLEREQLDQHIEQLKSSSEQQAKEQLKVYFIMDKIADKLKIEITEEEINGHIAQAAMQKRVRPERLKEDMAKDGSLEQFKLQVREQKCVTKLLETAKITEVDAKPEDREQKTEDRKQKAEGRKHKKETKEKAEEKAEKEVEKPAKKAPAAAPRLSSGQAKKHAEKPKAEEKTEKKKAAPRKKKT